MKNSETDRELIYLIKDTLESYEEQYILGSWENFVRIRKRRKKLILWFSCSGIAASLLLGWLGYIFVTSDSFGSNAERQQQNISNLESPVVNETLKKSNPGRKVPSITAENKKAEAGRQDLTLRKAGELKNINQTQPEITEPLKTISTELISPAGLNDDDFKSENAIAEQMRDTASQNLSSRGSSADNISSESELHRSDTAGNNTAYRQKDVLTETDNELSDIRQPKKLRFGVNFSPGVTSTSTASSFNYSGGINADLDLSRIFRLSTGLQVERQNIINESSDNPAWIPSGETQAELVTLDLPLNLTWKFLIRKSTCYYLSGGISSVIYVSEKYTNTSYTQKMVQSVEMIEGGSNVTYQLENVKTTEQETEAPFSTFDFAGRVNIIFGFEQHLSSRLFLHLEPYIKIPVSQVATENLRYTISGVTCKISF